MISRCHLLIRQSSVVIKSLAPRVSKFQNLQPAVRRRKRFILIPSSLKDEWTKEMREATMRNGLLLDQQVKTSEKLRESMTSLINSNNSVVRAQKDMMLQQETANQRVNMLIDTVRNLVDAIKRQSINITPPIQNKDPNFVYQATLSEQVKESEECQIYRSVAEIYRDPVTYKSAMNSKESQNWQAAVNEELKSMEENNVWSLVERPPRENIIDSRWVFKRKVSPTTETIYRARLVVRGFKDTNDYEIRETYAPVSRMTVIRSVFAIINKYNLEAIQLDVKTAFLNGILENDIYMEIPEGVNIDEESKEKYVCRLNKALYGLKVSPKRWNEKFSEVALKLGLQNDTNEPCLYTWRFQGKLVILVLYVDDIILASNCQLKLTEIRDKLCKEFKMKDLGEPKMYLGMEIQRDRSGRKIVLKQSEYIEKILEKFKMTECKPQETPMITRQAKKIESKNPEKQKEMITPFHGPFREAIGSLLYLAGVTRPDIAYAVNLLSRRQIAPTTSDWTEVKRIFRYLRGSINEGLVYRANGDEMKVYTDSSFGDCEESKSTSGYIIKLFDDTVAWRSKKQTLVTRSTCGAEYYAMSEACQEIISLDKALRDMIGRTLYPVTIQCDNRSAKSCTEMEGSNKLKCFDLPFSEIQSVLDKRERTGVKVPMTEIHGDFIKQCVKDNRVKINWVASKENLADIMTKPLPLPIHKYLREKIANMSF
uniref:Reverse transcriptase Ty1/copia-type domain-containing protein n=1 Tax=Trichogramma kaykai TaxID=54128 RepID=A0ABD2WZE0_9HYME